MASGRWRAVCERRIRARADGENDRKWNSEFCRSNGGGSKSERFMSIRDRNMSSNENASSEVIQNSWFMEK
ncbi:hypothetical protein C4D60_Mb01t01500 [Musa balbisiana]|uniref:Uncharacterized protein n=1 Tax=Musa balbisiana TaxID=52838 RepID=A0A4S8JJB2_MUSBA|nr:hypothetical protein C4D60_Mb01t01500 [Musa balbisiana]